MEIHVHVHGYMWGLVFEGLSLSVCLAEGLLCVCSHLLQEEASLMEAGQGADV